LLRGRGPAGRAAARPCQAGFSLVEALVALSITSLAGAVLLLAVESSLGTTTEAVHRTIADGIAQQTLHEILTKRYTEKGESPLLGPLGPATGELLGLATALFDDTDDYANLVIQPLRDANGQLLGTANDNGQPRLANFRVRSDFFQNWRLRVEVYYVNPANPLQRSATATSHRAIEVFVEQIEPSGGVLPLAHRRSVIAYVPPPQ
jgi:type II secretory pathway pseudopilin PulG